MSVRRHKILKVTEDSSMINRVFLKLKIQRSNLEIINHISFLYLNIQLLLQIL